MKVQFLGAADSVTGSRHLVESGGTRLLLDCGLFQGFKALRERNWAPLGVPPASIDAALLSHAHLDHSGWLPVLVREGFQGTIHASPATCDLAEVLLLDAAHLQEEDARRANRGGWSRHQPARPLYTVADARRALARFKPLPPGRLLQIGGLRVSLTPVGHLLGACCVRVMDGSRSLLFSGDVGRDEDLLMPAPARVEGADTVLVESTYGNRRHAGADLPARLGEIVRATTRKGGTVLLPTFAVGRAQALLLVLQRLRAAGEIPPDLPIVLDSPMAQKATELYQRHARLLRIPAREAAGLTEGVTIIETPQQSQAAMRSRWPRIVLAASGMATGGRVLGHLKTLLPNPRHHIVFPGFQVGGTRGANLVGGASSIKIFGEYIAVKAAVSHLEGFSGHADAEGLLAWLRGLGGAPGHCFVVHGEPAAADTLRSRIQDELGWRVAVPAVGSTHDV